MLPRATYVEAVMYENSDFENHEDDVDFDVEDDEKEVDFSTYERFAESSGSSACIQRPDKHFPQGFSLFKKLTTKRQVYKKM